MPEQPNNLNSEPKTPPLTLPFDEEFQAANVKAGKRRLAVNYTPIESRPNSCTA